MNYLQKSEKLLKGCLKRRRNVTLALVVSFLISGGTTYAEEVVSKGIQTVGEETTVNKNKERENTVEIDIKKSENGVSHNKFKEFSIDKKDIAILKNNYEKKNSEILESELAGNKNFSSERDEASLIIAEVEKGSGNKSVLAGQLEVLGKTADLVIANENGIVVNGQEFVNTNSVTLTTGKYQGKLSKEDINNIDKLKENFTVNGGEVSVDGKLELKNTKYFNILAQHIKINKNANIGIEQEAGKDTKLEIGLYSESGKSSMPNTTEHPSSFTPGIEALGSMYANKIILKTFGEDSKITTDKMIVAKEEIEIDSKTGRITLGGNIQSKKIDITTASYHRENWDQNKDSWAFQIKEKTKISAEGLSIKSKSISDIDNSGTSIDLKDTLNLNLKNKIENAEKLTKEIEKRFQTLDRTVSGGSTDLEALLDPTRIKVKKINLTAGGEKYSISTERRKESKPWTALIPAKESKPWTALIPAKESKPWTALIPAKEKNGKMNHIEVSNTGETHLLEVAGEEKSTIVNIAKLSKDEKISHNKYKKFSIKKGENVLLNNETKGKKSNSKLLNKEIEGNISLTKAAKLIINEVENSNQESTELSGGLEVLGSKADVVVANENGIVVNGGKFENIGNLDLSTGKYKDFLGNKVSYQGKKGDILLDGQNNFSKLSTLKLFGKNLTLHDRLVMHFTSESLPNTRVEAEIDEKILNKKIIKAKEMVFKFKNLENHGELSAENVLELEGNKIINEDEIKANILKIGKAKIENRDRGTLSGNQLDFRAKEIINRGEINAAGTLKINLTGDLKNESIRGEFSEEKVKSGLIKSAKQLEIKAHSIKNMGTGGSGKIVTEDALTIEAENLENTNSHLFSNKDTNIKVTGDIKNTKHGTIESNRKISLRAKTILNEESSIKSASDLKLFTDYLKNYSIFKSSIKEVEHPQYWIRKIRIKESWIKSWFNGYSLTLRLNNKQMSVEVEDSEIKSGNTLSVHGFTYDDTKNREYNKDTKKPLVENRDGIIRSKNDIFIDGEVRNLTSTATVKSDDLLSGILIDLDWNTSSLVENRIFNSGNDGKRISLKEALKEKINIYNGAYYKLLRGLDVPEVDRILNLALGADWKSREQAPSKTTGGEIRYYSKDKRATISSGGRIRINGALTNSPAADFLEQSDGRKSYVEPKVPVEYELATIGAEGTKPEKEKIEIHEEINQDVKKAKDFLRKENGIYKRTEKNSKYEYITSDFMTSRHNYKGYEYLNSKLQKEHKMEKETKVIGDNYYQHNVIMNMFQSSGVAAENITEEKVETLLDNASKEAGRLNLKIGTPLTDEQKKSLKEHIVWYVESEVNERKVLIPIVYTSQTKLSEEASLAERKNSKKEEKKEKNEKDSSKFKGLSRIEAEKNIEIETEGELINADSDIYTEGSAKFSVKNFKNKKIGNSSATIAAKEKLEIEAKEKIELDSSSLEGKKAVEIGAENVRIKASNVDSGKGELKIKAKNSIDIEDKKQKESSYKFTNTGSNTYNTLTEETTYREKSEASVLKGKDISIQSETDVRIKGSKLQAENHVDVEAENVNISNSTSEKIEKSKIRKNGFEGNTFDLHSDREFKKKGEDINKSSVEGNSFDIRAKKDITIEGSDLKSKEEGKLSAEEKLSIKNAAKKSHETLSDTRAKISNWTSTNKFAERTEAESSIVDGGNLLKASAKEIEVKGSELKAKKGEVQASEKIEFKAAEESYKEKTSSGKVGFFGNASAGGVGLGVEASFDTTKNEAKAEIINDYKNKEVKHKKSKLPALANAEAGVKVNVTIGEKEHKTLKNSQLNFGEEGLNVKSKDSVDLGGADIKSDGDLNVESKAIKTTKMKNVYKEKEDSLDLSLKQKGSVSSSVLDAANTATEITNDAKAGELNKGLAAAKVAGSITNLAFNDAIGANSTQALSFSYNHKESIKEEDTKNKIHVKKNLNFKTTEGDIELNNLDAEVGGKAKLDAEGKLKLKGGEKKIEKTGYGFNLEGRSTQTAGVSALFGANSQIGVGGTVGANYENFEGLYHDKTNLKANEVETESKDSTELEGAEIRAKKTATVKSGKDLKITSQIDKYSGIDARASLGANVSVGAASNTILAGRVSGSANAGAVYKNGEEIKERSGISAGDAIHVNVKNNLDLDAGFVGSDTKKGKLEVGKEIKKRDRETEEKSGGGFYGGSGGLGGEFGFDAEVGDRKDKKELNASIIGLEHENIVSEKVLDNGKEVKKEELENDLSKGKKILKDSFEKGGTASGSFSVKDSKRIAGKVKSTFKSIKDRTSQNNKISSINEELSNLTAENNTHRNLGDNDNNDLANRKLPSLPEETTGSEKKVVVSSEEKIYEDLDSIRERKGVEEDPYSVIPDKQRKESEVENPYEIVNTGKKEIEDIYAKVDLSTKTPKVETPEEINKRVEAEKTEKYGEKQSVPSEDNADYMTIKRVKDKTVRRENIEGEAKPKVESPENSNLANRKLPSLPEETTGSEKKVVVSSPEEKIYEDIDIIRERKGVEEDPYSVIPDKQGKESKEENPYEIVNTGKKEIEDIYAKVDLSTKTPKVETPEKINKRVEAEKTEKYGEKQSVPSEDNADYMTIKRVKDKMLRRENIEGEAKPKVESPENSNLANRRLPSLPEENTGSEKKVIVSSSEEKIYEDINSIRERKGVEEDPYSVIPEKQGKESGVENLDSTKPTDTLEPELPNIRIQKDSKEVGISSEEKTFKNKEGTGIGNTKYIPKKVTEKEKKALFHQAKQESKEKDSAKVAEKKLELIADNSKSIPKEHLLKSLKELAYGLSLEDASNLRKKSQETGKKINRPDVIEGFEGKNIKNMGKAFRNIEFDKEYIQIRENINKKIVEKLDSNKEFHDLMKTKLSGNEEGIKKLFSMVEETKREALQEVTGIKGKKADIHLNTENGPLSMKQGYYNDDVVNMNAVPIISFLRTKKQNNKEILDTIVHELTHHDQAQIVKNKNKDIPESMKTDADLLALNETYYINSDLSRIREYKDQPLEREAFFSGHKLGEQLSKLVDKGYTDKSKELKIEHLPNTNKNLEAPKEERTDLGNNALIYGLKNGREELIHRANNADKEKKNPILADSYIGKLNLGYEFSHLSDLAKKVNEGKVTDQDVETIATFSDPVADTALISSSRSRVNKANLEDNKKIISELLKNETAVNALKKMDDLYEKGKVLTEELKKNEYVDIENPKTSTSFTEEQNKTINDYKAVQDGLNKTRMDFFSEKTKLIAKETLERGGQVYFALDGLATDSMRYNKDKTKIDFENLKKLFNPTYEHYDAVTSHELRYLYENFKDNPNLKFTIKDQVIENPLKNLEIPKEFQK